MKIIIMALIVLPAIAFGNVTIHKNEFKVDSSTQGAHFWARLYDWKVWSKTSKQKALNLSTNFIKDAYENGEEEFDAPDLEEDDLISLLGPVEGPALYEFYTNRKEVDDPEELKVSPPLTTVVKVAVNLPDDYDIANTGIDQIYSLLASADKPHIHTVVSKEFLHSLMEPLHSAHTAVDELKNGKIILSSVNTGSRYYNCTTVNSGLKLHSGKSTYDGSFRFYIVNTVKELDVNSGLSNSTLVEGAPIKAFEQKIIYSSTLIKSGVNYLAFYKQANGQKVMVMNSVILTTSKLKKGLGLFVNGVGASEAFSGIDFKNGEAVLDSSNVDLSKESFDDCKEGLAKGVGRYVLGLAKSIAK